MNIEEFAALKVGNKITNPMNQGATGEVVSVEAGGVRVVWGPRHDHETRFYYSVNTTAWMHWSKNDETSVQTGPDDAAHTEPRPA